MGKRYYNYSPSFIEYLTNRWIDATVDRNWNDFFRGLGVISIFLFVFVTSPIWIPIVFIGWLFDYICEVGRRQSF